MELHDCSDTRGTDRLNFFKNKLYLIPENKSNWGQTVEPLQNGGHFKLPRHNLMRPGSNRVKREREYTLKLKTWSKPNMKKLYRNMKEIMLFSEACSDSYQKSAMELFAKIVNNLQALTICYFLKKLHLIYLTGIWIHLGSSDFIIVSGYVCQLRDDFIF